MKDTTIGLSDLPLIIISLQGLLCVCMLRTFRFEIPRLVNMDEVAIEVRWKGDMTEWNSGFDPSYILYDMEKQSWFKSLKTLLHGLSLKATEE